MAPGGDRDIFRIVSEAFLLAMQIISDRTAAGGMAPLKIPGLCLATRSTLMCSGRFQSIAEFSYDPNDSYVTEMNVPDFYFPIL